MADSACISKIQDLIDLLTPELDFMTVQEGEMAMAMACIEADIREQHKQELQCQVRNLKQRVRNLKDHLRALKDECGFYSVCTPPRYITRRATQYCIAVCVPVPRITKKSTFACSCKISS
jgi:hypothetical protein